MMVLSTGNRWIPAYAGMTVAGMGRTVIDRQYRSNPIQKSCLSGLSMFESAPYSIKRVNTWLAIR